jgi:hypothetical protein
MEWDAMGWAVLELFGFYFAGMIFLVGVIRLINFTHYDVIIILCDLNHGRKDTLTFTTPSAAKTRTRNAIIFKIKQIQ